MDDEEWLDAHPKYGQAAPRTEQDKIGVDRLERMLGILERATGQADPVPIPQAETLFVSKLGMNKVRGLRLITGCAAGRGCPADSGSTIFFVVFMPSSRGPVALRHSGRETGDYKGLLSRHPE